MTCNPTAVGLLCSLVLAVSGEAAAQTVDQSTDFSQYHNSPPTLVCTLAATVDYSGGILMRGGIDIMYGGQLKARACNPDDCWSYSPNSQVNVEARYTIDPDADPA